jgi:insertion element IS1 protein InsB
VKACRCEALRGYWGFPFNTVQANIRRTAKSIIKPPIRLHQANVEVDELRAFIGNKQNQYWIAYALNRRTGEVKDFIVGRRTKRTLRASEYAFAVRRR